MMPPRQVLVIDDDEDIREGLMDFLGDHGYHPVGAAHGREALDKLGGRQVQPCIILLDLMMPVMDGRAFRELQLQDPELARIPVVVISAYRDFSAITRDLGVHAQLPKPLDLGALLEVVQQHCAPM